MLDMQLECFNKVICRSKPYEAYLVVFNSFDASWRKRTEAVPRHAAASVSLYGHTSEMEWCVWSKGREQTISSGGSTDPQPEPGCFQRNRRTFATTTERFCLSIWSHLRTPLRPPRLRLNLLLPTDKQPLPSSFLFSSPSMSSVSSDLHAS